MQQHCINTEEIYNRLATLMQIDDCQYDFIYKRASYEVFKRFRINKQELWLLSSLYWFLQHRGKTVVSIAELMDTITGNARERSKMRGYLAGLIRLQVVGTFEYISHPDSRSIGLSDLGISVIKYKHQVFTKFCDKYARSPYRLLEDSQPSFVDDVPLKYSRIA